MHSSYWRNAYIASRLKNHILKIFDCKGTFLYQIGKSGTENRQLPCELWGICIESSRNHQNLLVSDDKNGCIYQFTMDNFFTGKTVDRFELAISMTVTPDGRILVLGEKGKKVFFLK